MKFITKTKCQYRSHIYNKGDVLDYSGEVKKCSCNGGCSVCGGTGRIDPPHYFTTDEPIPQKEAVSVVDELRQTLENMGAAYDRRWGIEKLKKAIIIARKEGKE
jgi:hypothetical protein